MFLKQQITSCKVLIPKPTHLSIPKSIVEGGKAQITQLKGFQISWLKVQGLSFRSHSETQKLKSRTKLKSLIHHQQKNINPVLV